SRIRATTVAPVSSIGRARRFPPTSVNRSRPSALDRPEDRTGRGLRNRLLKQYTRTSGGGRLIVRGGYEWRRVHQHGRRHPRHSEYDNRADSRSRLRREPRTAADTFTSHQTRAAQRFERGRGADWSQTSMTAPVRSPASPRISVWKSA